METPLTTSPSDNKYLINLHCHSKYSDGHSTIEQIAKTCRRLNHTAAVITDHLYSKRKPESPTKKTKSRDIDFSLNPGKWLCQRLEAADTEQFLGYPIILGIELSIKGYEEAVVFGTTAIDHLFKLREKNKYISIPDLIELRANFNCVINLCHPGDGEKFRADNGIAALHSYEYVHTGQCMFKDREDHYGAAGLVKLCNSDAHHHRLLYRCCNETLEPLTTESQIIDYIRKKKPITFNVRPHLSYAKGLFSDDEDTDGEEEVTEDDIF